MNKTSSAIVRTLLLGTSCLSMLGLSVAVGRADPAGGTVVAGTATITNRGANNTVINQTTDRALINWQSFSIAAGGSVRFNQPGSNSITVNRVIGSGGSTIYGSLLANGQIWLINGNGILFGKGSQVNVGGLIATTSDISDRDFAAGNYSFSGGTGASVVNQGTIHARNGGAVVLSGASVSNQGLIAADTGTVVLGGASAFTVDFTGDNLLRYAITAPAATAANGQTGVSNSGTIRAAGGRVIMTARAAANVADAVVNNTGMISATSARVANGEVVLDGGDGNVLVGGTIDASGTGSGQTGGSVAITGRNITVADNTRIDVSGDSGGGTVRIGGDLHGAGALRNADNTTVGSATITADAIHRGNGGTLVVWSNGLTDFSGIFSAKGGAAGGDGGFLETSGHSLNVGIGATVDTRAPKGKTGTWLLDPERIVIQAGEGTGTPIPPGGTLTLGSDPESTDYVRPSTIIAALASTNVTLQASDEIDVYSPVIYSSANALNLMSQGSIAIYASIQNMQAVGGGALNLIAGWDGATTLGAILSTPNAYGNNLGDVFMSSANGDVFVGSASGVTTVAASDLTLHAQDGGNLQLGYHGAGGGDINVYTTDFVSLTGQSPFEDGNYAMIGNGALDGSVSGAITGNIFIETGGTLYLQTSSGCDCADETGPGGQSGGDGRTIGIGNESGIGQAPPTGSVVFIGADVQDDDDSNGGFGRILLNDLAYGDVTVGRTDAENAGDVSGDLLYDSAHNFTFLSVGDITIGGGVQNAGTGAITLIAGWDGVYDPAHMTEAGHYGLNGGSITVGGDNAAGDAGVGAAHGALNLYGADLNIDAVNGLAQVGYHGAGGGDIFVHMTGNITAVGSSETAGDYALLGNGSMGGDVSGNITGNIWLSAGGQTAFFDETGTAWLGNVAGTGFTEVGDLTALTRSGFFRADYIDADLGSVPGTGGNVFLGFTDPAVSPIFIGGLTYTSPNSFVFAGAGSMNVTGKVMNAGSGAVTLVAGWDGHTVGSAAQLQSAGAYGLNGAFMAVGNASQFDDISVGSAGGRTTLLTGSLTIAPQAGYYAQVGYHGAAGGDIAIVARGALTLTAGTAAHDYAMIGNGSLNGDVSGNITGNIDIRVGGTTMLTGSGGKSWIGNFANTGFNETGNLVLVTFDLDGNEELGTNVVSDLAGGDVTIGVTDAASHNSIDGVPAYNSTHALNLLSAGSLEFDSSLQNSGSGAINVVAGWNGTTLDAAHFADAGVFGNNNGSVLIGGANAEGDVAVGSAGGQTTIAARNVTLSALNGYAQLGYHGTASGVVNVFALGAVALNGGAVAADYAQIGHGATFALNNSPGDVGIAAGSITAQGNAAVVGPNLKLAASSGGIGASGAALRIATSTLQVSTAGGNVFLSSPNSGLSFAGTGVNTAGGSFTLAAGGAIAQTAAIHTGTLNLSTTTGAITLTNSGNAFGALTVATTGTDNASFAHSSLLTIASATVGGTLTLAAGTSVNQSGAIVASALNVSATGGSIVLTNAANAFGTLTVATAGTNDAAIVDSTAVAIAGATIGGKLTLTANGAISQTGAIAAHGLAVTASSGAIALTKATNAVVGTVQLTTPGAATFYNSVATNVGASTVGGDFTLLSKGNVNFFGSVQGVTGAVTVVAGWDGTTTDAAHFGDVGVYGNGTGNIVIGGTGAAGAVAVGSKSGATSLYASNVTVAGNLGIAQLGYHGSGGGAIVVRALHDMNVTGAAFSAMVGNGSLTSDVSGNITGDIDVRLGGNAVFSDGAGQSWFGNVAHAGSETGNVVFVANDAISSSDNDFGNFIAAALAGGDVTLGFTGAQDQGPDHAIAYNSAHTLNILTAGNLVIAGSLQNAGSGAINAVAGWDGHTLAPASFGTAGVFGNNGKGIVIGGATAAGNVAFGSAGGTISVYGASLALTATNGYAQLGFNGHGAGAIFVKTTGAVSVSGGSGAGQFAQIGNGGRMTSGSNSGDIQISAGGDLSVSGGGGAEAYGQIGHGGAESNTGANGYSNVATITVTAANVLLGAGAGAAAYVEIGNGGYKSGLNLAGGTASNGGNITVTSGHAVTLTGNGADAYAQIGNGGSQSNLNAAASAGGSDSGDIVVHAPNGAAGAVTLSAGAGANAYTMIGNGGYAINFGPTTTLANWTVSGDISVTDLALAGGNGGANAYSVIGNGDASKHGIGNISGNIVIDANGQITYSKGTAADSPGTIGNFTGQGSVTGTLTGAQPPSDVTTDPAVLGNIAVNTAGNGSPTNTTPVISTVVITNTDEGKGPTNTVVTLETSTPGPLASLDNSGDSSAPNASDSATVVIADSLNGATKAIGSQTILAGMLKQTAPGTGSSFHGVPPADQDFSSWGNEALWQ
ncbi:MAG TPA: filamentous hemagglutinin N-terminal domain-containing protein [Rhizomicrobium sp.]